MIPRRILAFGASSVFGRVDPEGGGYIGRLKTWHEKNSRNHAVFNLGIGGDTTIDLLSRFLPEATAKNRNPNLIIFSIGHNDSRRIGSKNNPNSTELSLFKENIQELLKQAHSLCDVVFVGIHPIDDGKTQPLVGHDFCYLLDDAKSYSYAAKEICEEMGVPYLDIFNKFINKDYKNYLYEDGLHFNSEGHEKVFQELKIFLLKLYPNK